MPENEINAPVYIKGKISTPVYPLGHAFRFYFVTGTSWTVGASGDEDNWRLQQGGSPVASVNSILNEVFTRVGAALPDHSHVAEIELWHSAPGENILEHLNPLPLGNDYGSGVGKASAYYMQVYAGSLRNQWRFTTFDGAFAEPQRYPPTTPPDIDDGSTAWYFLKSTIPFATNDGIRLTRMVSENSGYNRKLARTYGRTIAP